MAKKIKKKTGRDRLGIGWRVTIYIAAFTAVLLGVVWLFQVVLLDDFYESEKISELMNTADIIEKNIDSDSLRGVIYDTATENGADILVITQERDYRTLEKALSFSSVLNSEPLVEYMKTQALQDGGACIRRNLADRPGKKQNPFAAASSENMIYCRIVQNDENAQRYVLVSVTLTPVDATVNTIQKQLYIISGVFIIIAVVLGVVLSRNISQPIIRINKSAKSLGEGKYDVSFDGQGYREVYELSQTLNAAAHELSKVDSLRRELIANISHDLRTPLTMITGYSEVMRDIPGENTPENIQVVIDEAEHLRRLVNDILSLSKIEAGMDSLQISEFNITRSVKTIIARYSKMKGVEGYKISFDYDSEVTVRADESKLSQVIYNLLNNAINYTGEDKKVKIVQSIINGKGAVLVRFDVYDTGVGISSESIKYIWDRYYKENRAHKRAGVGTGLGLSIVKGVIELHGGSYGVKSQEGKGSDFWFAISAYSVKRINAGSDKK